VPEPRPAPSVLRDALEETLGGPRVLIRPLSDRDGFSVVREDRGRLANSYLTTLVARVSVDEVPTLAFEPLDDRANLVQDAYRKHEARVTATQLSSCLVRVVESLGGTRLRPSGAVYWIPGHKLADWAEIAKAVESTSDGRPSAVYLLRHRMDADAVRAVRDAVVAEVKGEAKRIQEEVASGVLGTRGLENRKGQARDLRDKVLMYEDLSSVGLADLHRTVDEADQAAATAALLIGASRSEPAAVAVAG
jgi:hypothetical protein